MAITLLSQLNKDIEAKADLEDFLLVTEAYARRGENIEYLLLEETIPQNNSKEVNVFHGKCRFWGICFNLGSGNSFKVKIRDTKNPTTDVIVSPIIPGNTYHFIPGLIFNDGLMFVLEAQPLTGQESSYAEILVCYEPID